MKSLPSISRSTGLTLLEMLVALAILGIMAAVGVPSLMDTVNRMAVTSAARTISSSLSLARSEAVKRGSDVSICPSADGTDCESDNWAGGWIVFVDANGDADGDTGSVDAGDTVIRVFDPLSDIVMDAAPATDLLTYDSKGYGQLAALTTFTICPLDGDETVAKEVEISLSGRARIISSGASCL
jgi:type IV fimbrial biogenesis protein FimT